jgi:hypothetical protein
MEELGQLVSWWKMAYVGMGLDGGLERNMLKLHMS